jgi:predicted ribosomally synthesized peptide with SipW-like signal peptide
MKRNILVSLMIIGAVAALISGATFSAFTDDQTVTGTLTTGTVDVSLGESETLNWTPTACDSPIGSQTVCTSTINVTYTGLSALLDFNLSFDSGSCFDVAMTWSHGPEVRNGASPQVITGPAILAQDGTLTVTVQVANLEQSSLDACQDTTINLTLVVTASEDV